MCRCDKKTSAEARERSATAGPDVLWSIHQLDGTPLSLQSFGWTLAGPRSLEVAAALLAQWQMCGEREAIQALLHRFLQ